MGGLDNASGHPASEAVVLMVRSIFGDFKQPLAYFNFDKKMTAQKLKPVIEEAISKLQEAGLTVKTLVCDQAAEHQALYSHLFKVTADEPYIHYGPDETKSKIYCLFDPPHLLKSIKANLRKHVALVGDNSDIISWASIIEFYEADSKNESRIAPKLTYNHIYGAPVTNMNVPMAAQVFSRTVSGGIRDFVSDGIMDPSTLPMADTCLLLNDLFDSCNSRLPKNNGDKLNNECPTEGVRDFRPPETPTTRNPLKEPVSDGSLHMEVWRKAEKLIKTIRFFHADDGVLRRPPCVNNWLVTINALRSLWQ